jgi:hypothetical protein
MTAGALDARDAMTRESIRECPGARRTVRAVRRGGRHADIIFYRFDGLPYDTFRRFRLDIRTDDLAVGSRVDRHDRRRIDSRHDHLGGWRVLDDRGDRTGLEGGADTHLTGRRQHPKRGDLLRDPGWVVGVGPGPGRRFPARLGPIGGVGRAGRRRPGWGRRGRGGQGPRPCDHKSRNEREGTPTRSSGPLFAFCGQGLNQPSARSDQ